MRAKDKLSPVRLKYLFYCVDFCEREIDGAYSNDMECSFDSQCFVLLDDSCLSLLTLL